VPGVEELLRFESSVQLWPTRSALEDVEIAGTIIPAGSPIFVCYGSANRDPERFENPDRLDLERPNNEHVGYSQGIHYCFGAPLARLEAQFGSASSSAAWRTHGSSRTRRRTAVTRSSAARSTSGSISTESATERPSKGPEEISNASIPVRPSAAAGGAARGAGARARAGAVLVKVGGAGACHSDLHLMEAPAERLPTLPFTIGHENAGWVEKLGPGATGFAPGDPVMVYGPWGCGT
jgi:hypothetical protein